MTFLFFNSEFVFFLFITFLSFFLLKNKITIKYSKTFNVSFFNYNFCDIFIPSIYLFFLFIFSFYCFILFFLDFTNFSIFVLNGFLEINVFNIYFRCFVTVFFFLGFFFYYNEIIKELFKKKISPIFTFEYLVLLLLLFVSVTLFIVSKNLFLIFLLIEFQSILMYFIISLHFENGSIKSALNFFFQNIVISLLFMLGLYFIYFTFESFDISFIGDIYLYMLINSTVFSFEIFYGNLGFILICFCFLFKLGVFPFHFWILDVIRKNNLVVVYFIGIFLKIIVFFFLLKFLFLLVELKHIFFLFGFLSLLFGSLGGLIQVRLVNLFFFSSLTHMGLLILIYSFSNFFSIFLFCFYFFFYFILSFFFVFFLCEFGSNTKIFQLSYFFYENQFSAVTFCILFFSFVGLPPLAGFFLKFFTVLCFYNEIYTLSNLVSFLVFLLSNIFGLFLYLRMSRYLIFGDYNFKSYFLFDFKIRENFLISEFSRSFLLSTILVFNLLFVFCYNFLYSFIIEYFILFL